MKANPKRYIALSTMCKDRIEYILEWIVYHLDIGVQHIILYDNNDYDLSAHLRQFIDQGQVTVIKWVDNKTGRQVRSQNDTLIKFGSYRWIGFIDIDEFIVLLDKDTDIKQYLQKYEQYDSLGLYWLIFGSSGHLQRQKTIIDNYTICYPGSKANWHIKILVNPKRILHTRYVGRPHFIATQTKGVDVGFNEINGCFGSVGTLQKPIIHDVMRINHYYTRSKEDFEEKKARGGGNKVDRKYVDNHFNSYANITRGVYNNDIMKTLNTIQGEAGYG